MNVRRLLLLALLALLVMACQSGTTSETTAAPVETTDATEETTDPDAVSRIGDLPAECTEALRTYLQLIEPVVEDFDFRTATMEDFEVLSEEIASVTEDFEEETQTCPELDSSADDGLALIREFAESEAPGTVGYFTFLEQFLGEISEVGAASGDCETDIAAFQEFVDRGGSMSDLTAAKVAEASSLMSSIGANCSDERFLEWTEQEEVAAWIEGAG